MAKYATLKDVAQRAGTTAGTVSYVLNNKSGRYISDETRKKVLDAAKELDYIKCAGASSLKGKSRKLLSILVPQFENQFFTRLVIAAEKVFMEYGYDLLISNTDDNPEKEKEILDRMVGQRVEGFLVTPTTKGGENTEFIRNHEIPVVIIDRPLVEVENYCWITTDNYRCGYVGADYLARMGHEKIGYVGWNSGIRVLDARCDAVFDALRANGRRTEHVKVVNDEFSYNGGYQATRKLIADNPDLTAIFYGFNVQASGGVNCLRDLGIGVPEDISVVLVGSPEWAYTGLNNFTHVDMGEMELGRRAAHALLDQINGKALTQEKLSQVQDCSLVPGATVKQITE